jgi:hypothetical protein
MLEGVDLDDFFAGFFPARASFDEDILIHQGAALRAGAGMSGELEGMGSGAGIGRGAGGGPRRRLQAGRQALSYDAKTMSRAVAKALGLI